MFSKRNLTGAGCREEGRSFNGYSLVQTGEHSGMLITQFDTKAKMNKYVKALSAIRRDETAKTSGQTWAYQGQVKASG